MYWTGWGHYVELDQNWFKIITQNIISHQFPSNYHSDATQIDIIGLTQFIDWLANYS